MYYPKNFVGPNQLSSGTDEPFVIATIKDPMACRYIDDNTENGIEYLYTIKSLDADGESPQSTKAIGEPRLPTPTIITIEPLHEQRMFLLSWTSVAAASGYRIEREDVTNTTTWVTIGQLVNGSTKFVDSNQLAYNTTYNYKIYAFEATSESLPSLYSGVVLSLIAQRVEKTLQIDIRVGDLIKQQVGK